MTNKRTSAYIYEHTFMSHKIFNNFLCEDSVRHPCE